MEKRLSLIGQGREALKTALIAAGVPEKSVTMRVNQLWNWIYVHGAKDFAVLSNPMREARFSITCCRRRGSWQSRR